MNVIVCVKQIPDPATPGALDSGTNTLKRDGKLILDESDSYGVEMALQLVDAAGGGEVTVVSMGSAADVSGLRNALAMGAAKAVIVSDDALRGTDALGTAKVLAEVIKRQNADLVLAATESSDGYTGTTPVQAQGIDALRAKFMLPVPDIGLGTEQGRFPRGAPGTSSGSPIAFGANWNDAFVGFGVQSPVRYSAAGDADGSASVGFGLGNSSNAVGLEVAVNALSSIRSGVGNRVGVGLKAHKLLGDNWGIALGVQGVQLNANADDRNSIYGVVTKAFSLEGTALSQFKGLTWSGGIGTEAFQMAGDLNTGKHGVGIFTSAALRVNDASSVILDWSGQDLNLGVSFVPYAPLAAGFLTGKYARGAALTDYGQALAARARLVDIELRKAREDIEQMRELRSGRIAAACSPVSMMLVLPAAMG